MFRMFSFLPPIGCYALAVVAIVGTYSFQASLDSSEGNLQSQVMLIGGIVAFLLIFAGISKVAGTEKRGEEAPGFQHRCHAETHTDRVRSGGSRVGRPATHRVRACR